MNIGDEKFGFRLISKEEVLEVKGEVLTFEHVKTGARFVNVKNDDENKLFGIGFRTPTTDDTGVPHILEHSVLCGSKKYGMKDPFAELARSSVTTFINAFTFPDKTVYPIGSGNSEELVKEIDVYLDAVFNPNIYKYEEILMQEGWRYHLEREEDEIEYRGVVYGEMKGVFSSPNGFLEHIKFKHLFPNNMYRNNYGGSPESIVDLTYDDFIEFHRNNYHPSNSYIFLYGDLDFNVILEFLDGDYLSNYEKIESNDSSFLVYEKPFENPREVVEKYSSTSDNYFFDLSFVISDFSDRKTTLGIMILDKILMDLSNSPLMNSIMKMEICENFYSLYEFEMLQPVFSLTAQNSKIEDKDKFLDGIFGSLRDIVENGLDENLIKSAINNIEIGLREDKISGHGETMGVVHYRNILSTWLYNGDPSDGLRYFEILNEIKNEKGFFENLIKKYFLENNHRCLIIMEPDSQMDFEGEIVEKLKKYKESLSSEELTKVIENSRRVNEYQEDISSDVNNIKLLDYSNIEMPKPLMPQKFNINGLDVSFYKCSNDEINYLTFYFNLNSFNDLEIKKISLLRDLLHEIGTNDMDNDEFSNLVNMYSGGLDFNISSYRLKSDDFERYFTVSIKMVSNKFNDVISILNKFFNELTFSQEKIDEVRKKMMSSMEVDIVERGHYYSILRTSSRVNSKGYFDEISKGISFYEFLKNDFDTNPLELISICKKLFKSDLTKVFLVTDSQERVDKFDSIDLNESKFDSVKLQFDSEKLNEGIKTSSLVQYVCKGFNFRDLGFKYNGSIAVLRNYLRFKYLWDNVRVKNGAYGCVPYLDDEGSFYLASYRDPNLLSTIEIYDELGKHLRDLEDDPEDFKKYVIGTLGDVIYPFSFIERAKKDFVNDLRGDSEDDLLKSFNEIKECTLESVKELSSLCEEIMSKNRICVVGNSDKIESEGTKILDNSVKLF